MYEYKYVNIMMTKTFRPKPEKDYHEVVAQHAKEGWRLVQIFAPSLGYSGLATYFELIFEREK
ncbi:MAG: DUF4177 domain-containing protein [Clostridiaceae bacterium]|nr:DUF4177 domain-containing protein [Clostridiaceae bacterium]